jgi:hypothetical protein
MLRATLVALILRIDPMICPECRGLQQFPPCSTCYGSGFAHCCEGERCQPADTSLIERPGQPTNDDLHTVLRRLYCAGQT